MYKYEFTDEEIFTNRIKTYPEFNLFVYQGNLYVNKEVPKAGTKGGIEVYNINSNRSGDLKVYPFVQANGHKQDFRKRNPQPMVKLFSENYGYIGPYEFISSRNFAGFPAQGTVTSSYSEVVPITRRSTSAVSSYTRSYFDIGSGSTGVGNIALPVTINTTASALQTAARKYKYNSRHFTFNSPAKELNRNLLTSDINFIFIPTVYYGSSIKRGSVILDYYVTGSKIASCHDKKENGELYETTGSASGSVVGIVLYDEGVIMLTGAVAQGTNNSIQYVSGSPSTNTWMHYGTTMNDGVVPSLSNRTLASASFGLNFKGTSYVNTLTMLAKAPKGHLNHSNNPTYKKKTAPENTIAVTGSGLYYEPSSKIANVVTSSYTSASFEKVTYISKIKVYDDNYNLIGVATMAKPIKKTEDKEYIFKLKLDI
tara:strand:- start:5940 stop:7217 length:1278 start_codon:yes stop_codon:yes gene_type:complete